MKYATTLPTPRAFQELYLTTGWGNEDKDEAFFAASLQGTWFSLAVYQQDLLVGFGRIISDGKLHAFVTEMIVRPEHQGQGLGQEILRRLVEHCQQQGIHDIQLFCARGKQDFYLKQDFVPRPLEAPGMEWKGKYG